ncbi:MAG: hypothetical protein PEPC_00933 [Peptostreptococcus russellii]
MAKKKSSKNKTQTQRQERPIKICTICEQPHRTRTQLCAICNKKSKELGQRLPYVKGKASISKLLWLKKKYRTNDIFKLLNSNPSLYWDGSNKKERNFYKGNIRYYHKSNSYMNINYEKWENNIPLYIFNEFKKHPDKELITISGEKTNPNIYYLCKLCKEEQVQTFKDLKTGKGHNCTSIKSSGEIIVEDYLKKFVEIKTQYDTLKCLNPKTKRQLPYDIEIVGKKILIEIQGDQHLKFIEYFHGTIENYNYQQKKDSYKKDFAEKKEYKLIYIYYDEIKDGSFKNKIIELI